MAAVLIFRHPNTLVQLWKHVPAARALKQNPAEWTTAPYSPAILCLASRGNQVVQKNWNVTEIKVKRI